jgi:hypothetical protein
LLTAPKVTLATAADTARTVVWSVPFKWLFPHTVLQLIQSLYLGEDLQLTINLAAPVDVAFQIDANFPTNPETLFQGGHAALVNMYSQHYLYIATEQNQQIRKLVMEQCRSTGIKIPTQFPYIISDARMTTTTTAWSQERLLNASNGHSLLRVYQGVSSVDDHKSQSANFYNYGEPDGNPSALGWNTIRTYFNDKPNQESNIYKQQVWHLMRPLLTYSVCQTEELWEQLGAIYMEDYSGVDTMVNYNLARTPLGGVSLNNPIVYKTDMTRVSGVNQSVLVWQIFVFLRFLEITPPGGNGVQLTIV